MSLTFLQSPIESILLFATAPVYLTIIGILQSKNLKTLKQLNHKKRIVNEKIILVKKLRKLNRLTPLLLLMGFGVHTTAYLILNSNAVRSGYFISMSIMYFIYLSIAWINFYLKGTGILKDIGDFNGLPGN